MSRALIGVAQASSIFLAYQILSGTSNRKDPVFLTDAEASRMVQIKCLEIEEEVLNRKLDRKFKESIGGILAAQNTALPSEISSKDLNEVFSNLCVDQSILVSPTFEYTTDSKDVSVNPAFQALRPDVIENCGLFSPQALYSSGILTRALSLVASKNCMQDNLNRFFLIEDAMVKRELQALRQELFPSSPILESIEQAVVVGLLVKWFSRFGSAPAITKYRWTFLLLPLLCQAHTFCVDNAMFGLHSYSQHLHASDVRCHSVLHTALATTSADMTVQSNALLDSVTVPPKFFPGASRENPYTVERLFGSVVLAPIVFEYVFRKQMFSRLLLSTGLVPAVLVTSSFSALAKVLQLDQDTWLANSRVNEAEALALAFVSSLFLQLTYFKTGSIVATIIMHQLLYLSKTLAEYDSRNDLLVESLPLWNLCVMEGASLKLLETKFTETSKSNDKQIIGLLPLLIREVAGVKRFPESFQDGDLSISLLTKDQVIDILNFVDFVCGPGDGEKEKGFLTRIGFWSMLSHLTKNSPHLKQSVEDAYWSLRCARGYSANDLIVDLKNRISPQTFPSSLVVWNQKFSEWRNPSESSLLDLMQLFNSRLLASMETDAMRFIFVRGHQIRHQLCLRRALANEVNMFREEFNVWMNSAVVHGSISALAGTGYSLQRYNELVQKGSPEVRQLHEEWAEYYEKKFKPKLHSRLMKSIHVASPVVSTTTDSKQ